MRSVRSQGVILTEGLLWPIMYVMLLHAVCQHVFADIILKSLLSELIFFPTQQYLFDTTSLLYQSLPNCNNVFYEKVRNATTNTTKTQIESQEQMCWNKMSDFQSETKLITFVQQVVCFLIRHEASVYTSPPKQNMEKYFFGYFLSAHF